MRRIYLYLFLTYTIVITLLSKDATLVFEWKSIIADFETYKEYRYLGTPTAYMPPLYPYYLLFFKTIFPASVWIQISCIFQGWVYFFSMYILTHHSFRNTQNKLLFFIFLLFFPPILVGITKVSSFALSTSIISLFFTLCLNYLNTQNSRLWLPLCIICFSGIYIRYEFIFLIGISTIFLILIQKLKPISLIYIILFVFIGYLPWCMRNLDKIGIFTYSTSLEYNFAKGNHVEYDIFSSLNIPYDAEKEKRLTDEYLYQNFPNEKSKNEYLKSLNQRYIKENKTHFIKNSAQKLFINFAQFFPGNYNFSVSFFSFIYSAFFVVFQVLLLRKCLHQRNKISLYIVIIWVFFCIFYSTAPLPRYILYYFPFFLAYLFSYPYKFSKTTINPKI